MKVTDLRRKLAATLVAGGFVLGGANAAAVTVPDAGFEDHVIDDPSGYAYGAAGQAGDPDGFNNPSSSGGGVSPWQALASGGNGIGGDNASWIQNTSYAAANSGDQSAEVQGLFAQNLTDTFAAGQIYIATVAASANGGDNDVVVSLYDAGAVTFLPTSTPELILTEPSLVTATPVITSGPFSDEKFTFTAASLVGLVGQPIGIAVYSPDATGQGPHIDDIRLDLAEDVILFLEVDTTTGVGTIKNLTGAAINIDYYEITSAGASLDPNNGTGWNSLQDQDMVGFPAGDGSGNGWEEAGGSGTGVLSEAFLTGNSAVADQAAIGLGALFDPSDPQDLVFNYGEVVGTTTLDADFDNDGDTDGDDFLVWQQGFGTTYDATDLANWQGEFGSTGGPSGPSTLVNSFVRYVTPAATAVPEPTSVVLVGMGLAALLAGRKKK